MTKVLIDTDPGSDDFIALMMALGSPDLEVQGLTTVGGNATLAHTTRNTLRLLEYMGRTEIPVARGVSRPLHGKYHYGYYYHGPGGLTVRLPVPELAPIDVPAPDFISRVGVALGGELVVIALGPMSNIARALRKTPGLRDLIREIVVMGGAVECPGNVTRHAEFNIYNDPAAADIVLASRIPVTLVGLDVTTQVYVERGDAPWFPGDSGSAKLANRILANWFRAHPDDDRYHLHDPLAVAAAMQPDLLTCRQAHVAVATASNDRRGQTTALYGDGPVRVAVGVDVEGAMALMRRLLSAGSHTS